MQYSVFRSAVSVAAVATSLCLPAAAQAQARHFDIPAQSASSGVRAFAQQAGIQVIVAGQDSDGRTTNPVKGSLDTRAALDQLLAGTGLIVRSFDGKVAILGAEERAGAETEDMLVVTGSRIARPEIESAMPVSVTNMDEAIKLGRISAYDALARDPALGIGLNLGAYQSSSSGDGGVNAGISAVNLRNLGTSRTLTLINGQRRVSAGATSSEVDINTIPVAMIDRIEIVTGGAAAIYGADAVTGAVNIITKRDIRGFNITASNGLSSRGDAREVMVSAATGGKFADDRGSFAIGATYSKIASLIMGDRISEIEGGLTTFANPANTGSNDGIPDNITRQFKSLYMSRIPTYQLGGKHYVVEGESYREARCEILISPGALQNCGGVGSDGATAWIEEQIRGGNESFAVMANVDYALTDAIHYRADFSFSDSKFNGVGHHWHEANRSVYFGGRSGAVATLDNPYLPASVRQQMLAAGVSAISINRKFANFPITEQRIDRQSFTLGQSLGGALVGKLDWQAFWQYGRTETDAVRKNIPWQSHWLAARDVTTNPVTGQAMCRDAAARAAGCIPINIFSVDRPSDALLAYVMADAHNRRVNTLQTFGASVSGSVFALPYGDVSIALGAEHRREGLKTTVDAMVKNRELVHTFSPVGFEPELDVSSSVTEAYGEIVVPVLKDIPFARRLELETAYRYSDYNTVGTTHTWKAGGTWVPFDGLTLRATRSKSVRVPNFGDLYAPQSTSTPAGYVNPCDVTSYFQNATRTANCRALGILTPLPSTASGQSIPPVIVGGGNLNLKPETSNSLTLGAILQPRFIPGLTLTADYWNIDIEDAITTFSFTQVLNLCVDLPTIENQFCKRIGFDPATKLPVNIQATAVNAARITARGIDFGAHYRRPLGAGRLNLSFKGTWLLKNVTQSTPGVSTGNVINDGDWRNNQHFRANLLAAYGIGKFNIALNTQFMSASKFDPNAASEQYEDNSVPARIYNDLSLGYEISEKYSLGIGVKNVLDVKSPNMASPIFNNYQVFDRIGRYFFVNGTLNF